YGCRLLNRQGGRKVASARFGQPARAEPVLRRGKISIRADGRIHPRNWAPPGPALPHPGKRPRESLEWPLRGGTEGSNPASSSADSTANLTFVLIPLQEGFDRAV